jgi:opacity protein-like surface antigen
MKKLMFIFAMLVVCIAGASAQEEGNNDANRWSFGVRAGVNFAHDKNLNTTSNTGFDVDLLSDFHLRNKLYLRTGLGFRQFSQKWTSPYLENSTPNKVVGNTINLPLRLAWKLPLSTNLHLDLETGAFLSYAVGGKSGNGDNKHDTYESDFKGRYNFGAEFGAGVSFKQFYIGVSNTFNDRNIAPGFTSAIKLGYTF